jgi:hypothetical protein
LLKISHIQNELIATSQSWALNQRFDSSKAIELRRQALLLNHAYYLKNIPVYKKVASAEGIGATTDIETLKRTLIFPDEIFKSYSQEWLDNLDFARMNGWLAGVYHQPVDVDVREVRSIDDWLECLGTAGIDVTFSSGTSGLFSFVPRDKANRDLLKMANICCLAPLLMNRKIGLSPNNFALKQALKMLSPETLSKVVGKNGLPGFDAFFLGFRQGKMGNQSLMQELAPVFRKHFVLYNTDLRASVLRSLRQAARTPDAQILVDSFQNQVVGQRELNYLRLIEQIKTSIHEGQKTFIFGAPYQFKELCDFACHQKITLKKGSIILFGGGWKSFSGEAMQREDLVKKISDCFDLPNESILEGYSMTEISMLMIRCEHGYFHVPPIIEPVIFDDELNPIEGKDIQGVFGFLDPLAVTYPGFIISGDHVHLVDGECRCGLVGPALTDIGRARSREVKGCGGIMGSITA